MKLNKTLLLSSILCLNLFADNSLNDEILSNDRNKLFELNSEQINEESKKLKKDWINPITYQYTKNLGSEYKNSKSVLSINQPIFKSGGIYEAIKYANSTKKYSSLDLESQKKALIKEAYNLLFSIKKLELNIEKTKLSVKNAKIDVIRKREQVLNGVIDSSFLDNALLTLNSTKLNLVELKYQKNELINNFSNIASKSYNEFDLPKLSLLSKEEFLKNNIELQKLNADITKKDNYSYMTLSKYLPTVNAFYTYTKNHQLDGNPSLDKDPTKTYGLSVTIPLDTRTFNDIQSSKIDYLKAKLDLKNQELEQENYFKTALNTILMIDEKIKIINEDLKLYDSILNIMEDEVEAQLKTQSDYDTLKNSQSIKKLDLEIYDIDKQVELLELYSKIN